MKSIIKFIFAILLCETAGLIGSQFTRMSLAPWYAGLAKPFFTPPAWVFAPVWTLLYAIMGVAVILLLWGMILALTIMFMRITRAAGWLMVPYLAWVTFASALNIGVAVMN